MADRDDGWLYHLPGFLDRVRERGAHSVRDNVDVAVGGVLYHHRGARVPAFNATFVRNEGGTLDLELDAVGERRAWVRFDAGHEWDFFLTRAPGDAPCLAWMTDDEFRAEEAEQFGSKQESISMMRFSFGIYLQSPDAWPDVEARARETIRELEGVLWDALADGVPESTMLSEEPPVTQDERRGRIKELLHPVLDLLDAEFTFHVSVDRPPRVVATELRESLTKRGQHVLAEVGAGTVLLAINPGQAHKALAIDPDIGVFAPLSVTISEEHDRTHVRCVRPSTLLIFFGQPDMQDILLEMEMLLWNSLTALPDARVHSRQPPLTPGTGQRTTAGGLPGGLGSLGNYRPE